MHQQIGERHTSLWQKGVVEKQSRSRARMEVGFVSCGEWVCCGLCLVVNGFVVKSLLWLRSTHIPHDPHSRIVSSSSCWH